jgi:hypothetical protein
MQTPTGFIVVPRDSGAVLSWNPSVEPELTGYRIFRSVGAGALVSIEITDQTVFEDTHAANGISYGYAIAAEGLGDQISALTATIHVVPQPSVEAPSITPPDPNKVDENEVYLCQQYSGIVINQNKFPADNASIPLSDQWVIQEFFLPPTYKRGTTTSEQKIPELSGFHLLVGVEEGYEADAELDYRLEYQIEGLGWVRLIDGQATGAPTHGSRVWMTEFFDRPVEVTEDMLPRRFRLGVRGRIPIANFGTGYGFTNVWYTSPNPLEIPGGARAYDATGKNRLTDTDGDTLSLCFRILGLVADEGQDFLGNAYRSAISRWSANDVSTGEGSDPQSFWLSKPNPSKFAVEALYFDIRGAGKRALFGRTNLVPDPSFEDVSNAFWVLATSSGLGTNTRSVDWKLSGKRSASVSWLHNNNTTSGGFALQTATGTNGILVKGLARYQASAQVNVVHVPASGTGIRLGVDWYTAAGTLIVSVDPTFTSVPSTVGEHRLTIDCIAPSNARYASVKVFATSSIQPNDSANLFVDEVMFVAGDTLGDYFDGSMPGYQWSDIPHQSESLEVIYDNTEDIETVIDQILLDPMTPSVYFNVYYSSHGQPGQTDDDWDDRLWIHVPKTFRMNQRQVHVLPEPIKAKYIKIEFSHLQARYYQPGNFAQPILYKKHPKWVLDYFLAQVASASLYTNQFGVNSVEIIYDALDLAYNYYLDDLKQEPDDPAQDPAARTRVQNFLGDRTDASDQIDPQTLAQINLTLAPYKSNPLLASRLNSLFAGTGTYRVESTTPATLDLSDVSTLNRDQVVLEQDYPVMFFYLTARHKYREVQEPLSHDSAYFVGIRELSFIRQHYATATDDRLYVESNVDTANAERNDFLF